jgi:hypothetical protein
MGQYTEWRGRVGVAISWLVAGQTSCAIYAGTLPRNVWRDPFVQVRADHTRPHEGTEPGLAISRDLARGMVGDLTVESALRVLGAMTFVTAETGRRFSDLDVLLAEDLAWRAAMAVDNAPLHGDVIVARDAGERALAGAEALTLQLEGSLTEAEEDRVIAALARLDAPVSEAASRAPGRSGLPATPCRRRSGIGSCARARPSRTPRSCRTSNPSRSPPARCSGIPTGRSTGCTAPGRPSARS